MNIEHLQLASLLDETLELVGRRLEESRINLVREYSADLPPIMGDGKQLKQVFINLLNNAAEVMPGGGEIRIRGCSAIVQPESAEVVDAIRQHSRLKGYLEAGAPKGYLLIKQQSNPMNFVQRCKELGFKVTILQS